ncbi:MAG TPA: DUF5677 domain-containing protein [Solirubrobacteraceae bacterium]|nr:DUF5677 domain-containing protein [Solirubrobacteraceae bacterium]
MENAVLDLVREGLGESGDSVAAAWMLIDRRNDFLIPARAAHGTLQAEALDRWAEAFDLLDLELLMFRAVMSEHEETMVNSGEDDVGMGALALNRLFWAGYVTANEVLTLFRAGFSAGALGRWRALHEITTRAELISQAGMFMDDIGERYLEHENLRGRAELRLLRTWLKTGGGEQVITRDLTRSFAQLDNELVDRYGNIFRGEYGWAHELLLNSSAEYEQRFQRAERLRGPTFADLERHVREDYDDPRWWELLYSEASAAVHGSPRAVSTYDSGVRPHRGPDLEAMTISPVGAATARRLASLAWGCTVPTGSEPDETDKTEALMQMLEAGSVLCGVAERAFREAVEDESVDEES